VRLALPDHNQFIFLFATMEADPTKACNQDDVAGFIQLNSLRLKVVAKVHGKKT
jgi:hypothetical protein